VQLAGAMLGAAAAQRGPLWWVAHHRLHHKSTDRAGDPHSPVVLGFWRSHVGWIFEPDNARTALEQVPDLARYPELVALDRHPHVVPVALGAATFALGELLHVTAPQLSTSGLQLLLWGFVLPTVALYHSTFAVNSVAHRFGYRRFDTADESRNNWLVSVLTLGEGWHNNHHAFPNSARQGLGRLELDPTWVGIRLLVALRLVESFRPAPARALAEARRAGRATPGARPQRPVASPSSSVTSDGTSQDQ